jgi:hypothetical protein
MKNFETDYENKLDIVNDSMDNIENIAQILFVLSETAYHDCRIGEHNNRILSFLSYLLLDISDGIKDYLSKNTDVRNAE